MYDPTYPAFPIFSCLAFVLVLIPLPWHLHAWNSGTCLFIFWTAIANINQFINSIVWRNDAINRAPVWCDISARIIVAVTVALPASSLCINRRLYKIATTKMASYTRDHKRRAVFVDLAIGLGIPVLQMILQYVVQGHRFNIFEQVGCYPTTYNTPPAYPLVFLWANVIGLVSAVYCVLTLRAFMKRRAQFAQLLSSNHALSMNRYFRLMALALTELLLTTPLAAFGVYLNASSPIYPWISWTNVHLKYSNVGEFPAILWRLNRLNVISLTLAEWIPVLCALLFFVFFGFADEAKKNYRRLWSGIRNRFNALHASPVACKGAVRCKETGHTLDSTASNGSLPLYMPKVKAYTRHESSDFPHNSQSAKSDSSSTLDSRALDERKVVIGASTPVDEFSMFYRQSNASV